MNLNLYSIYDRKMNIYLTPFPSRGDVDAKRQVVSSFGDASMRATPAYQNPQDFDLVKIGAFDDESGRITPAEHPLVIAGLESLKAVSEASQAV